MSDKVDVWKLRDEWKKLLAFFFWQKILLLDTHLTFRYTFNAKIIFPNGIIGPIKIKL